MLDVWRRRTSASGMIRSHYLAGACAYALALVPAPAATAQLPGPAPVATSPLSVTLPTPVPTLTPIPAPTFSPQPAPTRAPEPVASPPAPTPTASAAQRTSRVRQVPTAPLAPTPTASPTPTPSASEPVATPLAPAPVNVATPTPVATAPAPASVPANETPWPYILGAAALLLALGALAWLFRRRSAAGALADEPAYDPATDSELAPVAPAQPVAIVPTGERARVAVSAAPRRAGVNLLTATVDIDVTLENRGTVPATAVTVAVTLTSAGVEQDRTLGELFAAPPPRPAVAPFALAPGERRVVRVLATMPRSDITELSAAGRPMFVPVVALDVRYDSGAGQGQTAQALAVGVERPNAVKLAPFWLDGPPRMFDTVAMRAHGVAVER